MARRWLLACQGAAELDAAELCRRQATHCRVRQGVQEHDACSRPTQRAPFPFDDGAFSRNPSNVLQTPVVTMIFSFSRPGFHESGEYPGTKKQSHAIPNVRGQWIEQSRALYQFLYPVFARSLPLPHTRSRRRHNNSPCSVAASSSLCVRVFNMALRLSRPLVRSPCVSFPLGQRFVGDVGRERNAWEENIARPSGLRTTWAAPTPKWVGRAYRNSLERRVKKNGRKCR